MITQLGIISHPEDDLFLKMWQVQVAPADRILREHRHINFEIAMVVQGEGIYHTASGLHPMQAGDVFVFSGNEPHCIIKALPAGLTLINLHFNRQFFSRYCGLSDRYPNMFFAHSDGFCNRIAREKGQTICKLLEGIREELSTGKSQYESAVGAFVNLMFVELTRHQGYDMLGKGIHRAMDKILSGVRFIDAHYFEDITLEQIAEKSGIIILTDSDSAGFRLRHYLSSAVPKDKIKNVFIPDVSGKEKRSFLFSFPRYCSRLFETQ